MVAVREEPGSNGKGLTPKQEQAALALASGSTLPEAARKADCGATTISTWLHDQPAFRQRIRELRADLTERALGRLADAMTAAADTLRHLCVKGKTEGV